MGAAEEELRSPERWAHLRLSIIGPLLACPPEKGELKPALAGLAGKIWRHPVTGQPVSFGVSTLEQWYYAARGQANPVEALERKLRKDSGFMTAVGPKLQAALRRQYAEHPSWSYKLHLDNLLALVEEQAEIGPVPSYSSLRRFMQEQGLLKQRRRRGAAQRGEPREVRSYEAAYVGSLWHLDFHNASRSVLTPEGAWVRPVVLGILDDRSRLLCHAQWYLRETAENLVHGLTQAFLKRGLPASLLTDNGSAMIAAETTQGLRRLSVEHRTTLPYSPHQNGKQESFWGQLEGRCLKMLENVPDLTLGLLNEATQAWLEMEYQRAVHSETGQAPMTRWLDGPSVARPCPESEQLRQAFTVEIARSQRRSDGTLSIEGTRFEIPSRFRHLARLAVRYASWDHGHVWLADRRTGKLLARLYPIDKVRNAEGVRRPLEAVADDATTAQAGSDMAPLMRKLMREYAATGLPPAYIPKHEENQ